MAEKSKRDSIKEIDISQKVNSFEVFRDEQSLDNLIKVIRDDKVYNKWSKDKFLVFMEAHIENEEKAAKEFGDVLELYIKDEYREFFEEDDALREFCHKFREREESILVNTVQKMRRVIDGEDPEVVFESRVDAIRVQEAIESN